VSEEVVERRLTTILAADVVGYSRLMAADEAATLTSLKAVRRELIEPKTAEHHGRVVKLMGDGTLMEFGSVVDAVRFAVDLQQEMAARNDKVPEDRQITFRIGINIGDIIVEGDDIYGDGVNVAARLEAAGAPGHVVISDDARRQVAGRVDAEFHDNGPVTFKNIAEPVRIWSWPRALADVAEAPSAGQKPGVHVALFEARGADAAELAEAVRDDLATTFARQTGLTLIADKKKADYIVGGAIRASGGRWRITAQLTDRASDFRVWSERYDDTGDDLFELQDHCVFQIAGAVRTRIPIHEAEKSADRPLEDMTVEELLNHAMGHHFKPTRKSWDRAVPLLEMALNRDSDNWMAMTMLSFNIMAREHLFGWRESTTTDIRRARALVERAQRLNPNSDSVRVVQAALLLFEMRDHGAARIEAEHALFLNPNYYSALWILALIECTDGATEKGKRLALQAADSNPGDPLIYRSLRGAGVAHAVAGEYGAAADWFLRADRAAPDLPQNLIGLAACRQLGGDAAGARAAMAALLDLAPDFNLGELNPWPLRDPDDWTPFRDALVAAGAQLQPPLRVVEGGAT
jgi:adenylate cyclase